MASMAHRGWKGAGLLGALLALGAAAPLGTTDLRFTGNLTWPDGGAMTGTAAVGVALTGSTACTVAPVTLPLGPDGRFELSLSGCAASLKSGTNVGATLSVNGTLFPRTLFLVPYALQANHAATADQAQLIDRAQPDADAGSLAAQVKAKANGQVFATRADGGFATYSVRGTYCGSTTVPAPGAVHMGSYGGYQAMKLICEQNPACNDGRAHQCTTDDVLRSVGLGVAVPAGVYATGVIWNGVGVMGDCGGWTVTASFAQAWDPTSGPGSANCGASAAVLCCK